MSKLSTETEEIMGITQEEFEKEKRIVEEVFGLNNRSIKELNQKALSKFNPLNWNNPYTND